MYKNLLLILGVISLATSVHTSAGFPCVKIMNQPLYEAWNLKKINDNNAFTVDLANGQKLEWAACGIEKSEQTDCSKNDKLNTVGNMYDGNGNCSALSQSGSDKDTEWTFSVIEGKSSVEAKQIKKSVKSMLKAHPMGEKLLASDIVLTDLPLAGTDGLRVSGNNKANGMSNVVLNFVCNADAEANAKAKVDATFADNVFTINMESKDCCGLAPFSFWDKIGWGQYLIQGAGVIAALIMCFYGTKVMKPSLGLVGFAAGAGGTYAALYLFIDPITSEDWYMWVILGVSALMGIVVCILMIVLEKFSFFCAGGFVGFIGGQELYQLVLVNFDGADTPIWYYVTIVVCTIVGALLVLWIKDHIVMLATAIGGAYLSLRMVGLMTNSYPDEVSMARDIAAGRFDGDQWYLYLYPIGQILLAVLGVITQCCIYHKTKKEEEGETKAHYKNLI